MQLYDQRGRRDASGSAPAARSTISTTPGGSPRASASRTTSSISSGSSASTSSSNFVSEYAAGRTPIPCVHCNGDLKFATLAARAEGFGADVVATGHYARVERDDGDRALPAEARRRRGEGSVVLPVHADPGAARARDVPGRRARQDGGARAGARARAAGGRQAGQPRDLLRAGRRSRGVPRARTARRGRRGAIRDVAGTRGRHATTASTASPSASARASASPPRSLFTSSASTPAAKTRDRRSAGRARAGRR